jgi:hypothetical protein
MRVTEPNQLIPRNRREAREYLALMGDPSVRRVKPAQPPLPEVSENPVPAQTATAPGLPEPSPEAQPGGAATNEWIQQLAAQQRAEEQRRWLQRLIALAPPADNEALRRIHARAVRSAKHTLGVTRTQGDIRRQGRERARRFRAKRKAAKAESESSTNRLVATLGNQQIILFLFFLVACNLHG